MKRNKTFKDAVAGHCCFEMTNQNERLNQKLAARESLGKIKRLKNGTKNLNKGLSFSPKKLGGLRYSQRRSIMVPKSF